VLLDFDHRDPATKRCDVARLAVRKPWSAVLVEIAKCDVRCVNCHRKRTAEQFNWRRGTRSLDPAAHNGDSNARQLLDAIEAPADQTKQCSTCKRSLPLSEFAVKNRRTGLRSSKCRACQRAYAKAHYRKNRDKYLAKARRRNAAERERFAAMVLGYLSEHPCVDCGATDLRILEFDHREGGEKTAAVSAFLRAFDWDGLIAEIAKCDVRCANCHRRRTARQFGWKRLLLSAGRAA